jgi:hypothetical protein
VSGSISVVIELLENIMRAMAFEKCMEGLGTGEAGTGEAVCDMHVCDKGMRMAASAGILLWWH